MLSIRYCPEAITPALLALLRPRVCYDADGRASVYLVDHAMPAPELKAVAAAVCPETDPNLFRCVILQAYRDGRATTPCHSDLGSAGFILSVGATRTFRVHRVSAAGCGDGATDAISIECVHGTAVVMDEAFHSGWHHQVVADESVTEERLSLVFRR